MAHGRLHGKVALVTGSDSGIGRATAEKFAKEEAGIAVVYLHHRKGAEVTSSDSEDLGQGA